MRTLLVAVFMLSLVIAGCGGSGGGSGGGGLPLDTNNTAPSANANASPEHYVITGSTVTLDGSASSDADGDLLSYAWSFVSRPPGSSAALSDGTVVNPTFIADVEGSYVLSLVVDDGVASAEDTVLINTIADYSSLFLKATNTLIFRKGDIILAGSQFSLEIQNTSSITFVCTRVELHNGVSVEGFTEDPAELSVLLGGDQIIEPNEIVGITFTLQEDVPAGDFQLRYYLTRPDTDEEFIVFHQYDLSSQ